jgi:hypothetical protein
MITVELNVDRILDSMTNMISEIENTKTTYVPETFMEWQLEDMNRIKPNITKVDTVSYSTRLWRVAIRRRRIRRRAGPILRPSMYELLCVRMMTMMQAKLKWQ